MLGVTKQGDDDVVLRWTVNECPYMCDTVRYVCTSARGTGLN